MSELNNDLPILNIGDTVTGTVVNIEEKQVLVDIGYKTEGIVQLANYLTYM